MDIHKGITNTTKSAVESIPSMYGEVNMYCDAFEDFYVYTAYDVTYPLTHLNFNFCLE